MKKIASFAQISPKYAFKYTIFFNFQKTPNLDDLAFKKAKWQP